MIIKTEPIEIKRFNYNLLVTFVLTYVIGFSAILHGEQPLLGSALLILATVECMAFLREMKETLIKIDRYGFTYRDKHILWGFIDKMYIFKRKIHLVDMDRKIFKIPIRRGDENLLDFLAKLKRHIPPEKDKITYLLNNFGRNCAKVILAVVLFYLSVRSIPHIFTKVDYYMNPPTVKETEGYLRFRVTDLAADNEPEENERFIRELYIRSGNGNARKDLIGSCYVMLADDLSLGFDRYRYKSPSISIFSLMFASSGSRHISANEQYYLIDDAIYGRCRGTGGHIEVEYAILNGYRSIVGMRFHGSHIFRMDYFLNLHPGDDVQCEILDGSYMRWQ